MTDAPRLEPNSALFVDFDGTLVDIAASPEHVVVEPWLVDTLRRLHDRLDGALAVVSGRPIADIDRWLTPLSLPVAGVHGAERRRADAVLERMSPARLEPVVQAAEQFAAAWPGVAVERKAFGVALHYRLAPAAEQACLSLMRDAVQREPSLHLLHGKMVVEVLPKGVSKGHAVEAFLREPPFVGRRPTFIGDDVTDESAFEVIQRIGGVAIKVGEGPSVAAHRIDSAEGVRLWLRAAAQLNPKDPAHVASA